MLEPALRTSSATEIGICAPIVEANFGDCWKKFGFGREPGAGV